MYVFKDDLFRRTVDSPCENEKKSVLDLCMVLLLPKKNMNDFHKFTKRTFEESKRGNLYFERMNERQR